MPYKEKEITKLFYSIGEVAAMFKVNTSLIRFWEKEFAAIKPQKNKKGNRLFTSQDIDTFHTIYHLVKDRGFTLQGAKEKLKKRRENKIDNADLIKSLENVKSFLLELKSQLKWLRFEIKMLAVEKTKLPIAN